MGPDFDPDDPETRWVTTNGGDLPCQVEVRLGRPDRGPLACTGLRVGAVEDIAAVGPFGDFLSLDATMRHMREQSQPEFLDRRVREDWESRGSTDLYQRCVEKAREVIREYKPEPLPDDVAARIRAIVEETDRAAGVA